MSIAVVLGTRPEIIKMSPIVRLLANKKQDFFVVHSGQHYSYDMDKVFFDNLNLDDPKYNLEVGSWSHGKQTSLILDKTEKVLIKETPDIVLVQGDTNTVLAGALAATKLGIKVGHVEAGLRSYDRRMPEETNRVLTDHMSDLLFAPTDLSKEILIKEGINEDKVFITGNTIVDAVNYNIRVAKGSNILDNLDLSENDYILNTVHRAENTDSMEVFTDILAGLKNVGDSYGKVVYPMHPRTKSFVEKNNLKDKIDAIENLLVIDPLSYFDFLRLEMGAKAILTDSGGVQEESCILGVPCITLRENTERPETVDVGANTVVGTNPNSIVSGVKSMLEKDRKWSNPFGDGTSSQKILDAINSHIR